MPSRRAAALALLLLGACEPELPDASSAGAQVYQVRCSPCHRLYDPGSMTTAMWEVQLRRMQDEMVRRGVNPLTEQEHHLVMSYLRAHASDAGRGQGVEAAPAGAGASGGSEARGAGGTS